jgi:hypothetical protein
MSGLHPTKTRLDLLRAVADFLVFRTPYRDAQFTGAHGFKTVTARITELERAGRVHLPDPNADTSLWRLTDAGRAVLDAAEGAS